MKRLEIAPLAAALAAAACGGGDEGGGGGAGYAPQLSDTPCGFELAEGFDAGDVRCASLTVPEDRTDPEGPTVTLAVAVYGATGPSPAADPVVFLGGGPGSETLGHYTDQYAEALKTLLEDRDFVFFDQRGTGRSKPSLACPEYDDAFARALSEPLTLEETSRRIADSLKACHDRLVDEGIDPTAYTSAASARDVADLVSALGYDRYDLYGISYGTRLALTALRDVPDGIRSVILDSTVPVEANLTATTAADFENSLDTLLANCAADAACDAAFPDLDKTLFDAVAELNASPATLSPKDPQTGETVTVVLDGYRLLGGLFQALYVTELIPNLPFAIATTASGDYSVIEAFAATAVAPSGIAYGMYHSVECNEEVPFVTQAMIDEASKDVRPEVRDAINGTLGGGLTLELCEYWTTAKPDPIENEPVASDVPTLVLSGEYDPVTPWYYGQAVSKNLSRSQWLKFDGFGHGLVRAKSAETARPRCAVQIAESFLASPEQEVDASCRTDIPPVKFLTP